MSYRFKIHPAVVRAIRVFFLGAVASMALVTWQLPATWTALATSLNALALAGVYGGVTGVLAGIDKWYRG